MKHIKQLFRQSCFIAVILLVSFSIATFFLTIKRAVYYAPEQEVSQETQEITIGTPAAHAASVAVTTPIKTPMDKLVIPTLEINAGIETIGINTKGNISAPSTFQTVGWYRYGPKPGNPGVALIDGHVNNGLGLAGVFVNLYKIKVGDDIYVAPVKGEKLHFVVEEVSILDYSARLSDILQKEGKIPQLALVTCSGDWIPGQKTYNKRLIILARLV